jgi:charged multivesicular body protein 2A
MQVSTAMNPQRVMADLQEFSKQNERMEMTSDMMDDAIDGMFDGQEDEADALVNQVLDEVGIDAVTGAVSAPKTKVATASAAPMTSEDTEIDKLLHSLKS